MNRSLISVVCLLGLVLLAVNPVPVLADGWHSARDTLEVAPPSEDYPTVDTSQSNWQVREEWFFADSNNGTSIGPFPSKKTCVAIRENYVKALAFQRFQTNNEYYENRTSRTLTECWPSRINK